MTTDTPLPRRTKFCPNCGTELPPGEVRFCIACGKAIAGAPPPPPPPPDPTPASGVPTVRLANAGVEQQVIGGTVKLPMSGAVPPGLWVLDEPPGALDVVAIYPPLRPVRDGWSGLVGRGWRAAGSEPKGQAMVFHFRAEVPWFPAEGCGRGLRLITEVAASSRTYDGRSRRGFRFGLHRDGPMQVIKAAWQDEHGQPVADRPIPQIQLMAPPRVPRVSDYQEEAALLVAREATLWVEGSQALGAYRLMRETLVQEHTPVGRGITLIGLREGREGESPWWARLLPGITATRYRVRIMNPFRCEWRQWKAQLRTITREAASLGLNLEPALAAEWWLDRNGYDGVIFTQAQDRYQVNQVVIAFRRAQLAQIKD
ncbi:zinc ribbon domain-containing protein [Candidatus Chloroploca asiatica]|uniref:Zinc-ribbon domain-containing protein n=1 Tax=Candidatus Chloroploca asiatica TaxID=1506545 RepID=A0A2H3KKP5_9CHLR|nr:zinc ribbon domain-containing protein [Candidatus Chloroploca asiatica]PDV98532.1 hypothetical protein A9Q02_15200 [Candidatus Chloroploca asiatica]